MFSMLSNVTGAECRLGRCCGVGVGGLPAGWQQCTQVVLVGHCGEPFEDVGEVGLGVVAVAAGIRCFPLFPDGFSR